MTPKVIVLVGPSNSGKTTHAKMFLQNNPDYVRINRDSVRHMLQFIPFMDKRGEGLVTDIVNSAAMDALTQGYNLLLDNCHCNITSIMEIVNTYNDLADIEFVVFEELPVEELVRRAEERSKIDGFPPTPREVIERMVRNFKILKETFDLAPIKKA